MGKILCPKKNTPDKDLVMTPTYLAKAVINHFVGVIYDGTILDPCRGEGAFFNNYPEWAESYWAELSEGVDFLECKFEKRIDFIITNPPWSMMREFLIKGMEVADNIVYLTTINHYFTKARLRDMREHGFGLKEILCVAMPKSFPPSGFQLGAVHTQRGFKGKCKMSYLGNQCNT